jgi:hypothetical protein
MICFVLALASGACASSQGEQVKDARMEQADALADRRAEAVDEQASARNNDIEKRHDVAAEQIAESNTPGKSATQDLADVSEERTLYQSKAKAKLDKLAVRINAAHEKLVALGPKAPTGLQTDLQTAVEEHKLLERDVANLRTAPASSWEATTDKLEHRMSSLDDRVSKLTDKIQDV